MPAIWYFDESKNEGFPYIGIASEMPEKSQEKPYPLFLWRIKSGVNSGYPYFLLQPPPAPVPVLPVPQKDYICIFDMEATETELLETNGLAILTPSKCEITEVLNGEYSLRMAHPIDSDGKWEFIKEENIIRALGQYFTIKTVEWKYTTPHSGEINVFAEHIFYQLADPWIFPFSEPFMSTSCLLTIEEAMTRAYHHVESEQHFFIFSPASTWEWDRPYVFSNQDGRTIIDVLIGSGGIIDVMGGELFRDKLYFSINETMEGAKENAFDIRIGRNLCGITRSVDLSTFCSYYRGYDEYGGWWAWAWRPQGWIRTQFPHHIVRSKNYSYDDDLDYSVIWEMLFQDVTADFKKNCRPVICYEIDLADIRRNPDFSENAPDFRYKPGDTGRLFDEFLGEPVTIKITETTTDAITGDVLKVTIGSRQSFTRAASYPTVLAIDVEPLHAQVPVRDADGVFCYDADGLRIIEVLIDEDD